MARRTQAFFFFFCYLSNELFYICKKVHKSTDTVVREHTGRVRGGPGPSSPDRPSLVPMSMGGDERTESPGSFRLLSLPLGFLMLLSASLMCYAPCWGPPNVKVTIQPGDTMVSQAGQSLQRRTGGLRSHGKRKAHVIWVHPGRKKVNMDLGFLR